LSKYSIAGILYFDLKLVAVFSDFVKSLKENDCWGLSMISLLSSIGFSSKFIS
jgi:hypothetical protein